MPTYLVERYWPGVTSQLPAEALSRGRKVMRLMRAEGTPVHHVTSILIPAEEVVFSVYEAPSKVAVLRFNERAEIPSSRIADAIPAKACPWRNDLGTVGEGRTDV